MSSYSPFFGSSTSPPAYFFLPLCPVLPSLFLPLPLAPLSAKPPERRFSGEMYLSRWNSCSKRNSTRSARLPLSVRAHRLPEMDVSCFESGSTCRRAPSRSTSRASFAVCRSSSSTSRAEPKQRGTSIGSSSVRAVLSCASHRCVSVYVVSRSSSRAERYVSTSSRPLAALATAASFAPAHVPRRGCDARRSRPSLTMPPTLSAAARVRSTPSSKPTPLA